MFSFNRDLGGVSSHTSPLKLKKNVFLPMPRHPPKLKTQQRRDFEAWRMRLETLKKIEIIPIGY